MTVYAIAFGWGERKRFAERKCGIAPQARPAGELSERDRGFWDGYAARRGDWESLPGALGTGEPK